MNSILFWKNERIFRVSFFDCAFLIIKGTVQLNLLSLSDTTKYIQNY